MKNDTFQEIETNMRATPKVMLDMLRKTYFITGDILILNRRDTLMTYVYKCEIITNFTGDESIPEAGGRVWFIIYNYPKC